MNDLTAQLAVGSRRCSMGGFEGCLSEIVNKSDSYAMLTEVLNCLILLERNISSGKWL